MDARPASAHLMIVPDALILDLIEFENACTSPYTPGNPGRAQPLP